MPFQEQKQSFVFKRTIQFDLMIVLVLIAIIPVTLVNQFYYQKTRSFIAEKVTTYNEELVKQTAKQLEAIVTQAEIAKQQITAYLISPATLETYAEHSAVEKARIVRNIEFDLANVRRSFPAIADIYIAISDGSFYGTNSVVNRDRLLNQSWFASDARPDSGDFVIPSHPADYFNVNDSRQSPQVVSFVRKVVIYEAKNQPSALIQIDVDYAAIQTIISGMALGEKALGQETLVSMRDAQGGIIYCQAASCQPGVANLPAKAYTIERRIPGSDWTLKVAIPEAALYSQLNSASSNAITITLAAVAFSAVASYALSTGFARPIRKLVQSMEKAGEGTFDDVATTSGNAEIQTLVHSYNAMTQRIDSLMTSNIQKETEKTTAQLKALEAQINPHFLYNTLETIRSIALQNGVGSIAEICKSLADMFRYSISRGKEFVTLGEEIHHIHNYMNVQKHRYGDKIAFEYLVDDELLQYRTIKLILQPIVENAIFHGLETRRGQGCILLSAYLEQDSIYINIVDDGLGIEPEKVAQLNAVFEGRVQAEDVNVSTRSGIGLINVDSRIKLNYGPAYGLNVCSTPGEETVIRVHLPAVTS